MADMTFDPLGGFGGSGTGFDTVATLDATGDPAAVSTGSELALDPLSSPTFDLPVDQWNNNDISSINAIAGITDPAASTGPTPTTDLIDYANGAGAGPAALDPANAGGSVAASGGSSWASIADAFASFGSSLAHFAGAGSGAVNSSTGVRTSVPTSGRTATGFLGHPNSTTTILVVILVGVMVFSIATMAKR